MILETIGFDELGQEECIRTEKGTLGKKAFGQTKIKDTGEKRDTC